MKVGVRDNVKPSSVDPGLIHDNMDGIDMSTGTGLGLDMGNLIPVPAVDVSDSKGRQGHDDEQVQIESNDDSSWTEYSDGEDVVAADKKDVKKRVDALVAKLISSVPAERLHGIMVQLQDSMHHGKDETRGRCKKKM